MRLPTVVAPDVRAAVTAVRPRKPPRPRTRAARGSRAALTLWVLLALAGWGAAGAGVAAVMRAHQASSHLAALGGLTAVQGAGIEVVVTDSEQAARGRGSPSVVLVQDGDLVFLNMMLWYAGAKAVAINGERITAQSTITSSGPTVMINGRRMVGPFQVLAVGDPGVLRGVLEARRGVVDRMRDAGLRVDLVTRGTLTVPAANPRARPRLPVPIPETAGP